MAKRISFSKKVRLHVAFRDLWICRYCGRPVWPWQKAHIAHEKALAQGGSNDLSNLCWSHAKCNLQAGTENITETTGCLFSRFSTITLLLSLFFASLFACGIGFLLGK